MDQDAEDAEDAGSSQPPERDRIPAEAFFEDGSTGATDRAADRASREQRPDEPGGRDPGDWERLDPEAFYRGEVQAEDPPFRRWASEPRHHAIALLVAGTGGIFLDQASFLFQLVVGAPVFEELFKFGLALAVVSWLRLSPRVVRFAVALVAGAGFGVLEHYVTYATEPASVFRFRVAFHAATPALSMAVYDAVAPLPQVMTRWAATVPATVIHWLNNFGAVFLGVASLMAEEVGQRALLFGVFTAGLAGVLAVFALLAPGPTRRWVLGGIRSVFPRLVRDPDPGWDHRGRAGREVPREPGDRRDP